MDKKTIFYVITLFIIIILFFLYARFVATSSLIVKEIPINGLTSSNFHGLKIMHISDLHFGRVINSKKRLEEIKDKISLSKPDIVVLTGDLIDRNTKMNKEKEEILIDFLKNIDAKLGKFAIKGNHDVLFENWEKIISSSDFINLNDTYDLVYQNNLTPILISGISTNIGIKESLDVKLTDFNDYLETLDAAAIKPEYRILLIHEPDYIDQINLDNYDIVFAGHSHNGQVRIPFIGPVLLPEGAKKYYEPHYKIKNTDIYISSGIGTSVLNLRLFNRPSANLYRILKK